MLFLYVYDPDDDFDEEVPGSAMRPGAYLANKPSFTTTSLSIATNSGPCRRMAAHSTHCKISPCRPQHSSPDCARTAMPAGSFMRPSLRPA